MYICTCRVDTFRNTCPYFFLIIRMYFLDMYVHINIYIYKSKYDCFGSRESDVLLPDCSSRIRDNYVQNELTSWHNLEVLFPIMIYYAFPPQLNNEVWSESKFTWHIILYERTYTVVNISGEFVTKHYHLFPALKQNLGSQKLKMKL